MRGVLCAVGFAHLCNCTLLQLNPHISHYQLLIGLLGCVCLKLYVFSGGVLGGSTRGDTITGSKKTAKCSKSKGGRVQYSSAPLCRAPNASFHQATQNLASCPKMSCPKMTKDYGSCFLGLLDPCSPNTIYQSARSPSQLHPTVPGWGK